MSFKDYFSDKASLYAQARPSYPPELFQYLASLCQEHQQAWDCATGSGQAAVSLAKYFEVVQATDASSEQLEHAFAHPKVHYSVQSAETANFVAQSFDLVAVAQALHWFDLDTFYPLVQRLLKPKGVLAIWGYAFAMSITEEIDDLLQKQGLDPILPYWPPETKLLWNGYVDVPFPFQEIEPPALFISCNWSLDEFLHYLGTWSALRLYRQATQHDILAALHAPLQTLWGESHRREIKMPLFLRVGRLEQ